MKTWKPADISKQTAWRLKMISCKDGVEKRAPGLKCELPNIFYQVACFVLCLLLSLINAAHEFMLADKFKD